LHLLQSAVATEFSSLTNMGVLHLRQNALIRGIVVSAGAVLGTVLTTVLGGAGGFVPA